MLSADADVCPMDLSILLEEALAERGNAVMLIAHPADGEDAVINAGNAPVAHILGWPVDQLAGRHLRDLRPLVERPEDWTTLMGAVRSRSNLMLDLRLRVRGREVWLGFNLTFKLDAADGGQCGILIGRDITATRERNLRETESQHLLASVFLRIGAAVAIVDGASTILMANPACQQLLGYTAGEMIGKHVEDLIAPESAEATRAARTRQLSGAGDYVLRMAALAKGGARVPVTLHSTLLRDARDRQLRVATLIPEAEPQDPAPAKMPAPMGQVREVSLAALKAAYGNEWRLVADRAMLRAEQILKRNLSGADVVRRRNDHSFLVWLDASNEARNSEAMGAVTREIRKCLLDDADDVAPDLANISSIGAEAIPDVPLRLPEVSLAGMDLDFEDGERPPPERDPDALMQYLRAGAVATVESVTGRDGVERPIVLVDFEPRVRRCLYHMAPSLLREPDFGTGFDLMRLDLAVKALTEQHGTTKVLVPISWPALGRPRLPPDHRTGASPKSGRVRGHVSCSPLPACRAC